MWELDCEEGWAPKNWCFWTVVLEKTLESPLDCKEIQPVHPKGDQSWVFIGRTDAEVETPILWPPDVKNRHIGKDPEAGKDWGQGEKGTTEDEMVGWHHWLNGHDLTLSKFQEVVMDREALHAAVYGVTKSWTELNWAELMYTLFAEFVTILLLFCVLVFQLQGMWNLSSLTSDQTRTPSLEAHLNHWTAREVPKGALIQASIQPTKKTFKKLFDNQQQSFSF